MNFKDHVTILYIILKLNWRSRFADFTHSDETRGGMDSCPANSRGNVLIDVEIPRNGDNPAPYHRPGRSTWKGHDLDDDQRFA